MEEKKKRAHELTSHFVLHASTYTLQSGNGRELKLSPGVNYPHTMPSRGKALFASQIRSINRVTLATGRRAAENALFKS